MPMSTSYHFAPSPSLRERIAACRFTARYTGRPLLRYFMLCIALVLASAADTRPAAAADISLRPDLRGHLSELRTIYPWQGGQSSRGEAVPERPHLQGEAMGGVPVLHTVRDQGTGGRSMDPGLRVIQVSGVIEAGDTELLRALLMNEDAYSNYAAVVFDSPGGDMLEGIRMGVMLAGLVDPMADYPFAGVAVLAGSQCLSACALAFALANEPFQIDRRFIEEGAELGFHMGRLPEDQMQEVAQIEQVMAFTYDIVRAYNRLIDTGVNPPLLLTQALEHTSSDSFFRLRGDLRGWFFGFTPVSRGLTAQPVSASGMTMDVLSRACRQNLRASRIDLQFFEHEYSLFELSSAETLSEVVERDGQSSVVMFDGGSNIACRVTLRRDDTIAIHPFRLDRACFQRNRGLATPALRAALRDCFFPDGHAPENDPTLTVGMLADVVGCSGGRVAVQGFDPIMPPVMEDGGLARIREISLDRRILRAVNLRATPGVNGQRLGSLQPGDEISLLDCLLNDDGQGVWAKVRHGSATGWVSARFIATTFDASDMIPWED